MINKSIKKNKYEEQEENIMCEDGIFSKKQTESFENLEKCCHCGFELLPGEEAIEIFDSGDIIHRSCWNEYADENCDSFGKIFVLSDEDC